MAAKTSNGTGGGNWSVTSTWSGGFVPVAGTDTVTIAPGDTVNVDSASETSGQLIIGSDPGTGGTPALTVGSSSQTSSTAVIVNAGVTIRLRGDLVLTSDSAYAHSSTLTLSSGASLIMDPPSGGTYKFQFLYNGAIIANGATNTGVWPDSAGGNHCVIKTDVAGRGGLAAVPVVSGTVPTGILTLGGFQTCSFTDFANIGTTSTFGISGYIPYTGGTFNSTAISMTNCTFTACNYWLGNDQNTSWHGNFIFNDNLFTSSTVCTAYGWNACCGWSSDQAITTETKSILRCAFDAKVWLDTGVANNFVVTGNVFAGGIGMTGGCDFTSATYFTQNFIVCPGTYLGFYLTSLVNCYCYVSSSSSYFLNANANANIANNVWDGSAGVGNGFFSFSAATAWTFTGNLILQIPGGVLSVGQPCYANKAWTITCEHNLKIGNLTLGGYAQGLIALGGSGTVGQVTSCRSNIIWCASAGADAFAVTEDDYTSYTKDAVTVAGYNCFHNATSGEVKYNAGASNVSIPGYYQLEVTATGVPPANTQIGTGDMVADPVFTDTSLRNFIKWGNVVQGTANTYAGALAALAAQPSLIPSMMTWVRAGYVPTNSALKGATYSGDAATLDANGNPLNGTIGPMGYPSTGGTLHPVSMDGLGGGSFGNALSGI